MLAAVIWGFATYLAIIPGPFRLLRIAVLVVAIYVGWRIVTDYRVLIGTGMRRSKQICPTGVVLGVFWKIEHRISMTISGPPVNKWLATTSEGAGLNSEGLAKKNLLGQSSEKGAGGQWTFCHPGSWLTILSCAAVVRRCGVLRAPSTIRINLPRGVVGGSYKCSIPLIRRSRLTTRGRGGVGKNLSDGWNLNFAVGCTHACPFCYVDPIHKRFGASRYGEIVRQKWGDYFLVPENLDDAIERTPWSKWKDIEVMMSSTHDPYLPSLSNAARKILERALPAGVRICLQTRSFLVTKDLEFIAQFPEKVRLQVSLATMDRDLARLVEPRVPPPEARLRVLRQAKALSIRTGVILAPILPPVSIRPNVLSDIAQLVAAVAEIKPDYIYGESMHFRGENGSLVAESLGEAVPHDDGFDRQCAKWFRAELASAGLRGTWWPARRG